jgi:regulator of protease activity HflC (stomatin/prohibitin superfamily)
MAILQDLIKPKASMPSPRVGNPVSATLCILIVVAGAILSGITGQFTGKEAIPYWFLLSFVPAFGILLALNIAQQWEKAVVLRFGRFHRLAGPGIFWIIPIIDTVSAWIDHRVMVTTFSAQKTLTKDTVPINVDAVLFWVVWDAQKAALEVANYQEAITWAAQTALRDIIGKMVLADILVGREKIDAELQQIIDARTTPWGITVQSVEVRDIIIPQELEDAMSRQAQAERERQARIILGTAEQEVAATFVEAARAYANSPIALQLRAMNILYEGLKEKGALVVVPSTAVETMGLGTIAGLTSLAQMPHRPDKSGGEAA